MPFSFTLVQYLNWVHKIVPWIGDTKSPLQNVPGDAVWQGCCDRKARRRLAALCPAAGWACPYCYFWMCWFSVAAVRNIYKIWVATYVRLKSKQVRVCPLMCIYSTLTSAGVMYIWRQIQPVQWVEKSVPQAKAAEAAYHMFQWKSLRTVFLYTLLTLCI